MLKDSHTGQMAGGSTGNVSGIKGWDAPTASKSLTEQVETVMYTVDRIEGLTRQVHAALFGGEVADFGTAKPPQISVTDFVNETRKTAEEIEKGLNEILVRIRGV